MLRSFLKCRPSAFVGRRVPACVSRFSGSAPCYRFLRSFPFFQCMQHPLQFPAIRRNARLSIVARRWDRKLNSNSFAVVVFQYERNRRRTERAEISVNMNAGHDFFRRSLHATNRRAFLSTQAPRGRELGCLSSCSQRYSDLIARIWSDWSANSTQAWAIISNNARSSGALVCSASQMHQPAYS
jgi:hypothetical protein